VEFDQGQGDDSSTTASRPILQRETIFVPRERGRFALLFAMCTLAGVTMGFGLRGVSTHRCELTERAAVAAHATAPSRSCGEGCTWLGIQMADTPHGVLVTRVFEGSPAGELAAGGLLQPGDFIESIGPTAMHSAAEVIAEIRARAPGDVVAMRLHRPGQAVVILEAELGWISGTGFHRLR